MPTVAKNHWRSILSLLPLSALAAVQPAPPAPAVPQQPEPDMIYATPADTAARIAKAKAERPADQPSGRPQPLVRIPGYRALIEYRAGPTPPFIHDRDAEYISVLEGDGVLITGGTLVHAQRINPGNQRGTAISGGTSRTLVKGATVFLPAGVPHHFASVGKKGLSVIALHIPPDAPPR